MDKLPTIETERLILTELSANDIPEIVSKASNKNVSEFTLNLPHPYSEKDAVYWINLANQGFKNGTHYIFAIKLKTDHEFVGGVGLTLEKKFDRAEIGYWMAEKFWGKGYTTEATKAIMQFGFETLNLNKLTSCHLGKNEASGKVMQKSGLKREGELKQHMKKKGVYHDLILFGLAKDDYEGK